jgi:hypothetical protein
MNKGHVRSKYPLEQIQNGFIDLFAIKLDLGVP